MKPKPNLSPAVHRLFGRVIKQITTHPESYDQSNGATARLSSKTHCSSPGCLIGWAKTFAKVGDRDALSAKLHLDMNAISRLWYLDEWPTKHKRTYNQAKTLAGNARVAANRIKHWLKTDGKE